MNKNNVSAVILAAGEGTRIKAKNCNKVAFKLFGRPMICYGVDTLRKVGIQHIVVVVKFKEESVRAALGGAVTYVRQGDKKGTAAALEDGMKAVSLDTKNIIVMYGDDSAFYTEDLLLFLIREHEGANADVSLLSINVENPTGLGRIVRNHNDQISEIIEEKSATDKQKEIKEINTGCYCFKLDFLKKRIVEVEENQVSKEYYLTDIVGIALKHGEKVNVCLYPNSSIWFGVNDRSQWKKAHILKKRQSK